MNEKEIFEQLFSIVDQSKDTDGVVTCCLVRNGEVFESAVSNGAQHAEYMLLKNMEEKDLPILPDDILYVTVQPCTSRRPGSEGEKFGDCTTNLINAGVKKVVFGARFYRSEGSNERSSGAGISIEQVGDKELRRRSAEAFNSTNENPEDHLPLE